MLQPYHYEWLEHPKEHGMEIEKYTTKGGIPYLMVTRNKNHTSSQRITTVMRTFHDLNISIKNCDATLVMFHGKNGRKEDLLPVAERYIALGFTCLLIDLPAHGESPIDSVYYATKEYEQNYVDAVLDDVYAHISKKPLMMWGMSLGGAFAIQNVYHSKYPFKALVLVATFDRFDGVLKDKAVRLFGSFIGSSLYSILEKSLSFFDNFSPRDSNSALVASKLSLPIFMIHGKDDRLIDYKRGKALLDSFDSTDKNFALDKKGNHHNILITDYPFYKESGAFLLKNLSDSNKKRL